MRKDRESIFNKLAMISGHPLNTFVKENKAIQQVIDDIKENITSGHIDIKALKEKIYSSGSYLFIMPRKGICYIRCLMYDIKSADLRRLCGQLMMR